MSVRDMAWQTLSVAIEISRLALYIKYAMVKAAEIVYPSKQ